MRIPPKLERDVGIEIYATSSLGIDGLIRRFPEDFVVEEVLSDGTTATINHAEAPLPSGLGRYLICVLVKRNWDTLLAVRAIAQQLSISEERIQVAGIKDAKALTAQHVSIGRATPDLVSKIKIKHLRLYPLRFSNEKMLSTQLGGNRFHILVRAISLSRSEIFERMQNVKAELESLGGVPNFFGHQRFGTTRPITHLVGRHIVQDKWEEAALTFLAESSEYEHPDSGLARQQLWKTRNYTEALDDFPFQLKYERIMLAHLARHPRQFVEAFQKLPIKLCRLFVQAYQSYLFNRFLSQRIKGGMPIDKAQNRDYTIKIDDKERLALPIIGFKQPPSLGMQGEIEREILEKENITPQQFRVVPMQKISAGGGLRQALSSIESFSISEPEVDSCNPSKRMVRFGFMLGKGSYATVVLREFMKPKNLVDAGF